MMDIIEEKPVTLPKVAAILKAKEKEYEEREVEMLYGQRRALEHTSKFTKVSGKDADEMTAKLSELDLTLNAERIVKIIDLMPTSVDDIRAIFAKERFKYTEDEIKKIIEVVDQYR